MASQQASECAGSLFLKKKLTKQKKVKIVLIN